MGLMVLQVRPSPPQFPTNNGGEHNLVFYAKCVTAMGHGLRYRTYINKTLLKHLCDLFTAG